MNPAGCSIPTSGQQAHLPRGGNLARVNTQNAGHSSLLRQLADDLRADGSDRHEAWASLRARGAGAATHRHILRCAESRPPSFQVDDVAHAVLLSFRKSTEERILSGGNIVRA